MTYNPNKRDKTICDELIHAYFEAQRRGEKPVVKEILDKLEHNIHETPAPECPRCNTNAYMILEGNSWYCTKPTPDDISAKCFYHLHKEDKEPVKRPCGYCGKEMTEDEKFNLRWIHKACYSDRQRKNIPTNCIICGNEIERPRYGKNRCNAHHKEYIRKWYPEKGRKQ